MTPRLPFLFGLLTLTAALAGCGQPDVPRGPHTWAEDEPSVAARQGGDAWVAFRQWSGGRSEVAVRPLGQREVEATIVHASDTSILGTAMACDGANRLHVVWSEQVPDGWALRESVIEPPEDTSELGDPGPATTVVGGQGRTALQPALAEDELGRLLLVWQQLSGPEMTIEAALFHDGRWSEPVTVSANTRSNWAPACAALETGAFAVAWDGAVDGDYDVQLARLDASGAGELTVTSRHRVTDSPRFEAHASVATLGDRIYIAYDVGPTDWGREGSTNRLDVALHNDRQIEIVAVVGDEVAPLAVSPMEGTSPSLRKNSDQPRIAIDGGGNLVLFFRGLPLRDEFDDPTSPLFQERVQGQSGGKGWRISTWYTYMTRMDGRKWTLFGRHRQVLLDSVGRLDAPVALQRLRGGAVGFAAVGDGREEPEQVRVDVGPDTDPEELRRAFLWWWQPVTELPTLVSGGRIAKGALAPPLPLGPFRPLSSPRPPTPPRPPVTRVLPDGRTAELLLGDLHRHTDISRCSSNWDGSLSDAFRYALDVAPLDFLAITDHFEHMTRYDWWRTGANVDAYDVAGRLVNLHAYERADALSGHRNLVTGGDELPLVSYPGYHVEGRDDLEALQTGDLAHLLGDTDVVAIPHTPAGMSAGSESVFNWDAFDPSLDRLVEVFQGYRGSSEAEGEPRAIEGLAPAYAVRPMLDRDLRFGLIASSDHQSSFGAFAGVWATARTRASVFEALDQRRTFGSTVPLALWMEWDGVPMGSSGPGRPAEDGEPADVVVTVDPFGRRIERIELISTGGTVATEVVGRDEPVTWTFPLEVPAAGDRWVYARVTLEGGELAWSSPVWLGSAGDGPTGAQASERHGALPPPGKH